MNEFQLETPVAFIVFKRSDTTKKVFEAIRKAKPPKLFVIADGARPDIPGEAKKCAATREIIDRVDWDCDVIKNYSDINLGCRKRVLSGLDWVFDNVEEAIILEDDCLPDPTFFQFCEELLDKYRYDERVASISGQNVQLGRDSSKYSYYFSQYNHIWGWATWRRAWKTFDCNMKDWKEVQTDSILKNILLDHKIRYKWNLRFSQTYNNQIDTWDYIWQLYCWLNHCLGIIPKTNLISNIGFGDNATNTSVVNNKYAGIDVHAMDFPLSHPPFMVQNVDADRFTETTFFNQKTLFQKFKFEIKYRLSSKDII